MLNLLHPGESHDGVTAAAGEPFTAVTTEPGTIEAHEVLAVCGAVGAGAGTGAVLATKGEEVVLSEGTQLAIELTAPLEVTVERESE